MFYDILICYLVCAVVVTAIMMKAVHFTRRCFYIGFIFLRQNLLDIATGDIIGEITVSLCLIPTLPMIFAYRWIAQRNTGPRGSLNVQGNKDAFYERSSN